MRSFFITIALTLGVTHGAFAEVRSAFEKIYAPDFMQTSQSVENISSSTALVTLESNNPGARLKTESRRSIVLINDTDDLNDLPEQIIQNIKKVIGQKTLGQFHVFANFKHTSNLNPEVAEYYVAVLPKEPQIKTITLQKNYNSDRLSTGSQIQFQLGQSMTIIPQESDEYPAMELTNPTLIYSMQRVGDEASHNTFDMLDALAGRYSYALTLSSLPASQLELGKEHMIESRDLGDLSALKKKQVLNNCLSSSDSKQELGIYHFLYNSSESHNLAVLKRALVKTPAVPESTIAIDELLGPPTFYTFADRALELAKEPLIFDINSDRLFTQTITKLSELLIKDKNLLAELSKRPESPRMPNDNFVTLSGAQKLISILEENEFNSTEIQNFIDVALRLEKQPL